MTGVQTCALPIFKDENSKFKSYITRQFKKFIKNVNVKANDKDHKQSGFSQFKS